MHSPVLASDLCLSCQKMIYFIAITFTLSVVQVRYMSALVCWAASLEMNIEIASQ